MKLFTFSFTIMTCLAGVMVAVTAIEATTYTVTTTDDTVRDGSCDDGDCSLADAINETNYDTNVPHRIEFAIDTSDPSNACDATTDTCTIYLSQVLPGLRMGQTTVDGYSQPGAAENTATFPEPLNGSLKIVLDGSLASATSDFLKDGFIIRSNDNVLQGFVFRGIKRDALSIHGYLDGSHSSGNVI